MEDHFVFPEDGNLESLKVQNYSLSHQTVYQYFSKITSNFLHSFFEVPKFSRNFHWIFLNTFSKFFQSCPLASYTKIFLYYTLPEITLYLFFWTFSGVFQNFLFHNTAPPSNWIFNEYKRVDTHFAKLVVHFGYISFNSNLTIWVHLAELSLCCCSLTKRVFANNIRRGEIHFVIFVVHLNTFRVYFGQP